jgi:hypothetical protein
MELFSEFEALLARLDATGVEYALCGGLAMAVHGYPRATQDIDLLVPENQVAAAAQAARSCGYTIEVGWMEFQKETCRIFRLTKIDEEHRDVIPLDIIAVTPNLAGAWRSRRQVHSERRDIWVVSPEGLKEMKTIRGSAQDRADIEKLEGHGDID